MKNYFLFLALSFIFINNFILPQSKDKLIDDLMQKYYNYHQFNGSVLVADKGKIIFEKGYGFANMEWQIPNTPETKFKIGSITKQFTSMLIMQFVEKGKLRLDEKVDEIISDYPKKNGSKISIYNLLTHTSGIPNYTDFPDFYGKVSRNPYTPKELVKRFWDKDLEFEPGTKFNYSNSGYILLGYIIEKIAGKPYAEVLKENIFKPLDMKNSGYENFSEVLPKRASGYIRFIDQYSNAPYLDSSVPYAAGGIYSTVDDLYKWDQALYTEKLLSDKYKTKMFTGFLDALGMKYACGWFVGKKLIGKDSVLIIRHGGTINGFNSLIVRIINYKQLIILLNNTGIIDINGIYENIKNILNNQPYNSPKQSIVFAMIDKLQKYDIDEAINAYKDYKENKSDAYSFNEADINLFGYKLINEKKYDDAIAIFKLNVDEHPLSANAYDSLGEAYLDSGNNKLAIINYKKSLELNPQNNTAKEILKKLGSKK